ncbi:MAG: DinB family protein [Siphonobacter sp.]
MPDSLEVWLRGPLPDMPVLVQPVAHALLQAREELAQLMNSYDDIRLWERPAGLASAGFHLQHLTGVLDRLFTYARGEQLTHEQFEYLQAEGLATGISSIALVEAFNIQIDKALQQLRQTDINTLTQVRGVGRSQIPSTVIGLYVHAAEHTMRHLGQLLVTVKGLE